MCIYAIWIYLALIRTPLREITCSSTQPSVCTSKHLFVANTAWPLVRISFESRSAPGLKTSHSLEICSRAFLTQELSDFMWNQECFFQIRVRLKRMIRNIFE